jgi:hypothetical protein
MFFLQHAACCMSTQPDEATASTCALTVRPKSPVESHHLDLGRCVSFIGRIVRVTAMAVRANSRSHWHSASLYIPIGVKEVKREQPNTQPRSGDRGHLLLYNSTPIIDPHWSRRKRVERTLTHLLHA